MKSKVFLPIAILLLLTAAAGCNLSPDNESGPIPPATVIPDETSGSKDIVPDSEVQKWNLGVGSDFLTHEMKALPYTNLVGMDDTANSGYTYNYSIIYTREEYQAAFNTSVTLDGSGSVDGYKISGGASYQAEQNIAIDQFSLFLVVKAAYVDKNISISSYDYNEDAQRLMGLGFSSFKARYGDMYLQKVKTGADMCIVYKASSTKITDKSKLAAALNLKLQGTVNAHTSAEISSLTEEERLDINITASYFCSVANFPVIAPPQNESEINAAIANFQRFVNPANLCSLSQVYSKYINAAYPQYYFENIKNRETWIKLRNQVEDVWNTLFNKVRSAEDNAMMTSAVTALTDLNTYIGNINIEGALISIADPGPYADILSYSFTPGLPYDFRISVNVKDVEWIFWPFSKKTVTGPERWTPFRSDIPNNSTGYSSWAADGSDNFAPDAVRIRLYSGASAAFKPGSNLDFRIGIQLEDSYGKGTNTGNVVYTPWASQGGGESGWAYGNASHWGFDALRVFIETKHLPGFTATKKIRLGIQANGSGGKAGSWQFTPYLTNGGGYSGFAYDGDGDNCDPNGVRIKLETN